VAGFHSQRTALDLLPGIDRGMVWLRTSDVSEFPLEPPSAIFNSPRARSQTDALAAQALVSKIQGEPNTPRATACSPCWRAMSFTSGSAIPAKIVESVVKRFWRTKQILWQR
jgi:hypothetical protein